jgi:hypothetical protein
MFGAVWMTGDSPLDVRMAPTDPTSGSLRAASWSTSLR